MNLQNDLSTDATDVSPDISSVVSSVVSSHKPNDGYITYINQNANEDFSPFSEEYSKKNTTNISSNEIYYFTNTKLETSYPTLWDGYIHFKKKDSTPIILQDIDNILIDICNINFYIKIDILHIYLSMDQDEKYYHYQFEKHIKKIINTFEEMFNINVINGIFNATELKHQGNQYRYRISKKIDNKIMVSKKVLSWEVIDKKNKKTEWDNICDNLDKLII